MYYRSHFCIECILFPSIYCGEISVRWLSIYLFYQEHASYFCVSFLLLEANRYMVVWFISIQIMCNFCNHENCECIYVDSMQAKQYLKIKSLKSNGSCWEMSLFEILNVLLFQPYHKKQRHSNCHTKSNAIPLVIFPDGFKFILYFPMSYCYAYFPSCVQIRLFPY